MTSIFHSGLSKDLSLLLNDADDFDVIIQVGENNHIREFHAHSVILRARSSYFKGALSTRWIAKKNNMIMFNKPNITPTVFEMILKYIYTGELNLTKQSGEDILGLLVASDELLLEELLNHIQDYLMEEQSTWTKQNFILVLHSVFRLTSCKKLREYCFESICDDPQPLITSTTSHSLDKDVLFSLLKSDDLQIEEIVAWDYLIKWGIEQTPGLSSNRTKWNNEDYETLKKTLSPFIPLIRFVKLCPADYFDKVRPYKAIIPKHIYEEVEEFYFKGTLPKTLTLPPRAGKFESKIVKSKFRNIIANWIDKKDAMFIRTENDPLYKFKLIYRGSRDGISNDSFRNKCKGRMAGLVLIEVKQSNKIFGGYSSIGFSSIESNFTIDGGYRFYYSSDNFIFSFENGEDTRNMKISRVVNPSKAILDYDTSRVNFDRSGVGFNFGQGSLSANGQNMYAYNYCGNYEDNLNTESIYTIKEIETFVVVNK